MPRYRRDDGWWAELRCAPVADGIEINFCHNIAQSDSNSECQTENLLNENPKLE